MAKVVKLTLYPVEDLSQKARDRPELVSRESLRR